MLSWLANRKSTAFQQDIIRLEGEVRSCLNDLEDVKRQMKRNSDEAADMYDKTRRLYYRLTRREKVDSQETSMEVQETKPMSRDQILQKHYASTQPAGNSDQLTLPPPGS